MGLPELLKIITLMLESSGSYFDLILLILGKVLEELIIVELRFNGGWCLGCLS